MPLVVLHFIKWLFCFVFTTRNHDEYLFLCEFLLLPVSGRLCRFRAISLHTHSSYGVENILWFDFSFWIRIRSFPPIDSYAIVEKSNKFAKLHKIPDNLWSGLCCRRVLCFMCTNSTIFFFSCYFTIGELSSSILNRRWALVFLLHYMVHNAHWTHRHTPTHSTHQLAQKL